MKKNYYQRTESSLNEICQPNIVTFLPEKSLAEPDLKMLALY